MTDIIYQTCKCKKLFPHVVMYRIHTLPFKSLQEENKGGSKGKRGVWAEACLDAQKQVHRSRVPLAAAEPGEGKTWRTAVAGSRGEGHAGPCSPDSGVWTAAHFRACSSPEASKRQQGLGDKAQVWKQKTWTAFVPPPPTRPLPAKAGGGVGGGKAQLPLCKGFLVWKIEITPPIRKGLGELCAP